MEAHDSSKQTNSDKEGRFCRLQVPSSSERDRKKVALPAVNDTSEGRSEINSLLHAYREVQHYFHDKRKKIPMLQ